MTTIPPPRNYVVAPSAALAGALDEVETMPIGLTQTHTRYGGSSQKIACVSAKPYHSAIYPLWASALTR